MLPVALRTIHSNPGVAVRVGEKSLTWHPLGFRKCLSSSRLTASNFFSCPNLNVKLRSAAKAGTGSRDRRSRCLCFLSHLFGKVEVLQKKKGAEKKRPKTKQKVFYMTPLQHKPPYRRLGSRSSPQLLTRELCGLRRCVGV